MGAMQWMAALVVVVGSTAWAQPASMKAAPSQKAAACVPKDSGHINQMGRVEMTDLKVEGSFKPGETITVTARAAEVTGHGDFGYPGITLVVEPDAQFKLSPHTLYGVHGCGTIAHTWTFTIPATAKAGTPYRITALACSSVTCRGPQGPLQSKAHRLVEQRVVSPR
jgi:hypothetical protein